MRDKRCGAADGCEKKAVRIVVLALSVVLLSSCLPAKKPSKDPAPSARLSLSGGAFVTLEDTAVEGALKVSAIREKPLSVHASRKPERGTVELFNERPLRFRYTPDPNVNGNDAFEISVTDGEASVMAVVTLTVEPVNDQPVAVALGPLEALENRVFSEVLVGRDADGDTLSFDVVSLPTHGVFNLSNDSGAFTYTPTADWSGRDALEFRVFDGREFSESVSVQINISTVDNSPVASDGTLATDEDVPKSGFLRAVDADSAYLTYSIVSNGTKGTAVINNAAIGAFTYTPNLNANGLDSFTFSASDGNSSSAPARVVITINPVDDPPEAIDVDYSTDEDTVLRANLSGSDPDGDAHLFSVISPARFGSVTIDDQATGRFSYSPNPDFNGVDFFTFKVSDGRSDSDIYTARITVRNVNDPPVAIGGEITVIAGQLVRGRLLATDIDYDSLTYSIVARPSRGVFTLTSSSTGQFEYLAGGEPGTDSFTYKASDGRVDSNVATATVTVRPANEPPIADSMEVNTNMDYVHTGTLSATDPEGDQVAFRIVDAPRLGAVRLIDTNGRFRYSPNPGVSGDDFFTFRASDSIGDSNLATIQIHLSDFSCNSSRVPALPGSGAERLSLTIANVTLYHASVDRQGRILATGRLADYSKVIVARFLTNGTLDPSFGIDGKVLLDTRDSNTVVNEQYGVKVLPGPNNTAIVSGIYAYRSPNDPMFPNKTFSKGFVARLLEDGASDRTFNSSGDFPGIRRIEFPQAITPWLDGIYWTNIIDMVIDRQASVYLAARTHMSSGWIYTVSRVSGDGTADEMDSYNPVYDLAMDGQCRVLIGTHTTSSSQLGVMQRLREGQLVSDSDFGVALHPEGVGWATYPDGLNGSGRQLGVLHDNRIWLEGTTNGVPVVLQYLENGLLNRAFGQDGVVSALPNGYAVGSYPILDSLNRPLCFSAPTTRSGTSTVYTPQVFRWLSNGALDTSFGDSGRTSLGQTTDRPLGYSTKADDSPVFLSSQ